jgi:trans-AT polyketide synthase/acyltransferase/oxidoreductase domain-containing protein
MMSVLDGMSKLEDIQMGVGMPVMFLQASVDSIVYGGQLSELLLNYSQPIYAVWYAGQVGFTQQGKLVTDAKDGLPLMGWAPGLSLEHLGDSKFCDCYGTRFALYGGAMANAIASEEMVIALGRAGFMGSFGAAGISPARLEAAIQRIQTALPEGPYAFNLIHSPFETGLVSRTVELYLKYGIRAVEASAFLDLTPNIVYYRATGLSLDPTGKIVIKNRMIAKLSRKEVAVKFMQPAPLAILNQLLAERKITAQQAALAQQIPMADDITVEADSGGHTDNRPLVCLVPEMLALRDEIQEKYHYLPPVRVGAAGGISTPAAVIGAFSMGAAYIVTGSINQACTESGASEHTKNLLAHADMADVMMAPAADMFEMGVKVQVLKKGTLFPMRAQKLYELYHRFDSIEAIPVEEREKLEKQVFKREIEAIWVDTVKFFSERDPEQIVRAKESPKYKMALIFRWYLGLSSRWAVSGEKGREMDYQIWCGPAIGPFNEWTHGTYLEEPRNRHVVDVSLHLLTGGAYLYRLHCLRLQRVPVLAELEHYRPTGPLG